MKPFSAPNPYNIPNKPGHVYIESAPAMCGVSFRKIVRACKAGQLAVDNEGQIAIDELRGWIRSLPHRGRNPNVIRGIDYAVTSDDLIGSKA